jgi:hypothetical protein
MHPTFKRALIFVMIEILEDFNKTFLQNIPCLFIITGILKTNGI